ncbi:MAG: hypothetical protein WBW32_07650 [Luteibacter sp.]
MALELSTTRSRVKPSPVTVKSPLCDLIAALADTENAFGEFRLFRDAADERVSMLLPGLPKELVDAVKNSMAAMDEAAERLQKVAVVARKGKLAQPAADKLSAALEFQVAYVWAAFVTSVDEYLAVDGGAARRAART